MRILYVLIIAILASLTYDYYSRYTTLSENDTIHFFLRYEVLSVEECDNTGCLAKVRQFGEEETVYLTIRSFEPMPFIIRRPAIRQCTNVISTKIVTCDRDLRSISQLEKKYAKHPDWDLRPAANQVIYK